MSIKISQLIKFFLYIFIFIGVFFSLLRGFYFRLFGILILPTDLIVLLLHYLYFLFRATRIKQKTNLPMQGVKKSAENYLYHVILILILLATFIGLVQGNYWKSIFRETKLILYFGLIPVFMRFLMKDKKVIIIVFVFLIVISTLGSLYDLYCRDYGILDPSLSKSVRYAYTPLGKINRDYGLFSTFGYQVPVFLASLIFFLKTKNPLYKILLFFTALINLIANLLTVTRGYVLALIVGILLLIFLNGLSRGGSVLKAVRRWVGGVVVISLVFYIALSIAPEVKASFYRFASIFRPEYAGAGDIENIQVRLSSIYLGFNTALSYPLGRGFGILSPTGEETSSEALILWLLYHNSLGYIFYTFGIIGALILLYLFIKTFIRLINIYIHANSEDSIPLALILTSLSCIFCEAFTFNNVLFSINSNIPLVIFLFASAMSYFWSPELKNVKMKTIERSKQ